MGASLATISGCHSMMRMGVFSGGFGGFWLNSAVFVAFSGVGGLVVGVWGL